MVRIINSVKQTWIFVFIIAAALLTVTSCSDDTSTSFTNPNQTAWEPTGTVQGIVRDSVTLEPIAGAKVSIGVKEATTDAKGQYALTDVPATTDALNGSVNDLYRMTVDLRSVTSPLTMTDSTATPRYPDFVYHDVELRYTSLNDSTPCPDFIPGDADAADADALTTCGTNATNHDTPVEGLVASVTTQVGKLDANITGVVGGCDSSGFEDEFLTPVGAGYTVKLYSNRSLPSVGEDGNSYSGDNDHLLDQKTTDDDGAFSFPNVEANLPITIKAVSADGTKEDEIDTLGASGPTLTTPADGETLSLTIEKSYALHVCPNDAHGPRITAVSPEPGSDPNPGSTSVVITFSEAVKQTEATGTGASAVGNLYDDIEVRFEGSKAGNVAYSLAWNASFDTLTATFTTGASSLYYVRIEDVPGRFTDANGVAAEMGVCEDDSVPAALTGNPYGIAVKGTSDCTVYFTTNNGGTTPGTTTSLTVTNASSQNVGSTSALLDWPVISGAKTYNIYCGQNQVYQDDTTETGTLQYVTNVSASEYNLDPSSLGGFVGTGNEHSLQLVCLIVGFNADYVEGADSNSVTIKDSVGPDFTIVSSGNVSGLGQLVLQYNDPVNDPVRESDAETLTNYALTGTDAALTLSTASYDTSLNQVTLTYSGPFTAVAGGNTITVTGVKDLTGNTNLTAGSTNVLTFP